MLVLRSCSSKCPWAANNENLPLGGKLWWVANRQVWGHQLLIADVHAIKAKAAERSIDVIEYNTEPPEKYIPFFAVKIGRSISELTIWETRFAKSLFST